MEGWLAKFPLWLAYYPYKAGVVRTAWDIFLTEYKPQIAGPTLPSGCTRWTFWQFTGGKFILTGVDTAVDVNYFNGTLNDLKVFVGIPVATAAEPPVETPIEPAPEATPPTASSADTTSAATPEPDSSSPSLSLEDRVARLEALARTHGWDI
jgi:hypothetical protein